MSFWRIIEDNALSSVLAHILEAARQREELTSVIAGAFADRLATLTPQEKAEAKRLAKDAKQTLQNTRGRKASLAQEEADLTKALNKLLIEYRPELGTIAKVVVEALILCTQIDEIRKQRTEVKAKPKLSQKDSAALKALEDAGCPLWQLARLSKEDLAFVATFVREKMRDPRHRDQDGVAMTAFRAGYLELAVEGLNPDEEAALLLAGGRVSDADIAAKRAFEAAAGRPLQISPTLAGALSRAAERQRSDGVWPGSDRTVDYVEEKAFQQDLQCLAEALGGGEAAEERAWDILLPPSRSVDDPPLEDAESIARQMLEHLHGPDQDRWKAMMNTIGHDVSMRRAFADRLTETDGGKSGQASWARTILLAEDWRHALERQHQEEVRGLALLVRDRADVRWLAQSRGIDVPVNLTVELPLSRAANLLRQPVTELIWELFDLPPERQASSPVEPPLGYPAHNGSSHQDPGFLDHVANKTADVARIYLPPDANCLLSVADHCLRSRDYVNVIVAGKQPEWQWLTIDEAVRHCTVGAGIWDWASDDDEPDVVLACAGDVPTLAAATLLREYVPDIRIRVVNVVDLMVLQPQSQHPHGLDDRAFDAIFTFDRPVIFAFHGYPSLIHRLAYARHGHHNFHVRGYKGEGTTTTPFDMVVMNDLDRYRLALDAIERVPRLKDRVPAETARYWAMMERHKLYVAEQGDDLPEVRDWQWTR